MMTSSQETCLLCVTMNKNMINFYSDRGKELNIISILSTHFWFQLDEIKALSQNICYECWKQTESFHGFYQAIRTAHKKFETVFVKIENDVDVDVFTDDDGPIYQPVEPSENVIEFFKRQKQDVDDDDSDDTSVYEIPFTNSIETRAFDQLSKITQSKYINAYEKLMTWKVAENIEKECFSEAVMLEYFYFLSSKYKPSSLRLEYSMLRTTIQRLANIDISYPEVVAMLKKSSVGFQPFKYGIFQPDDVRRFFTEAGDLEYLYVKVVAVFLIHGLTSTNDLTKVEVNHVTQEGSVFVVKFPEFKTNDMRTFVVENEYAALLRKYKALRPHNVLHDRFFVNYQKGKCTVQPIGKHKFLSAPKIIAKFLKLENPESYTCNSFRKDTKHNRGGSSTATKSTITNSTNTATVSAAGDGILFDLLPEKSKTKYLRAYEKLMAWKTDEEIDEDCFSEEVMLEYFYYLKPKYAPPTLSVEFGMLRPTIAKKHNVNINYPELKTFLKTNIIGFCPQKCLNFHPDDLRRFLLEAEDNEYLWMKVVMIFEMFCITTGKSLIKVDVKDVIEQGSVFVIKIPEAKSDSMRSFTVDNEHAATVKKYKKLRPENVPHTRFFINYHNGQCTAAPIGKNKFSTVPKIIANYLNLKEPESYTATSFRKQSLKRNNILSTCGLDSYIQECIPKKQKIDDPNSDEIENLLNSSTVSIAGNKMCEDIKVIAFDSLPEKSREKYVRAYEKFLLWKTNEKVDRDCFSEAVMLEYFNSLSSKYKPSSLLTEYSMLRTTIQKNDNFDINYAKMKSFLKESSVGFQPQKSNSFRPDDLRRFLAEAEDTKYLVSKVILIFGIYGTTSPDELTRVEVKDVIQQGSVFAIQIPDTKTNLIRSFTVDNEYAAYVKKYKKLRPKNVRHTRFFINYQNGKCTVQPIGKNKFVYTPKTVANFLNLDDADNYTSRSFSKTHKKLLADGRLDLLTTKHDGGSSSGAADSYIEESCPNDQIPEQVYCKRSTMQNTSTVPTCIDTTTVSNALTIPTYHVQPQPYQLFPYGTGTVNMKASDVYVPPDNAITESILRSLQFNNCHNL